MTDAAGADPRRIVPPVPEDAPEVFKDRHKAMTDAFIEGQCPECLIYLQEETVVVDDPSGSVGVAKALSIDHLPACPLGYQALKDLADEVGYVWTVNTDPKNVAATEALAQAVEDLDIEE
jgi:hypothetical protein